MKKTICLAIDTQKPPLPPPPAAKSEKAIRRRIFKLNAPEHVTTGEIREEPPIPPRRRTSLSDLLDAALDRMEGR
jgi:hypothetical protein